MMAQVTMVAQAMAYCVKWLIGIMRLTSDQGRWPHLVA